MKSFKKKQEKCDLITRWQRFVRVLSIVFVMAGVWLAISSILSFREEPSRDANGLENLRHETTYESKGPAAVIETPLEGYWQFAGSDVLVGSRLHSESRRKIDPGDAPQPIRSINFTAIVKSLEELGILGERMNGAKNQFEFRLKKREIEIGIVVQKIGSDYFLCSGRASVPSETEEMRTYEILSPSPHKSQGTVEMKPILPIEFDHELIANRYSLERVLIASILTSSLDQELVIDELRSGNHKLEYSKRLDDSSWFSAFISRDGVPIYCWSSEVTANRHVIFLFKEKMQ